MINVVVAEDHHLVRQGIIKLLENTQDLNVVGEANNGEQVIELVNSLHPDVIILDIAMPNLDGLETLNEIKNLIPKPQVVVLSMHADPNIIRQALQAGALGYVVKQSVAEELIAAVHAASIGSVFLSSDISNIITNGLFTKSQKGLLDSLSPREREVVKKIVEGFSTHEIAESLHVSVKTIEKQRRDAMRKLNVDNVASLVRVSLELGLLVD
jgi:DNA-binding NarL/FixJ family response regulator